MTVDYIMHKELQKVLDLLTPENRLVMQVAMSTGLRVSDVLCLKRAKIARQFWIKEQKTKKRRRVNLSGDTCEAILLLAGDSEWAFPGRDPRKHRTRQTVWADVKRAQKAFRLPQNLGTHTARKAYAVDLMARHGDIERVRRALNHRDASITVLYAMADVLTERRMDERQKRRRARGPRSV